MKIKAYTKTMDPIYANLPINVIGTGSSGNSVFIEPINTLIDVGLRFNKYDEKLLQKIKYIFLTHKHGDHFIPSTIHKMLSIYPIIKLYTPTPMMELLKSQKWYENHKHQIIEFKKFETLELNKTNTPFKIKAYPTKHGDLINYAYDINIPSSKTHILYASDLEYTTPSPFENPELGLPTKERYNLILLEANYDQESINHNISQAEHQINNLNQKLDLTNDTNIILNIEKEIKQWENFIFRNSSNYRHLEEKEAIDYVLTHLTDGGIFIPLHASHMNGSYTIKQH